MLPWLWQHKVVAGAAGAENAFPRRFSSSIILQNRICVFSSLGTLSCWKTVVQCRIDYSTLFSKAFCWRFHSLLILGQIISTEIWDGYIHGTKINHQIILDFYNTVTWLRLGLGLFHCVWLERSRSWSISQLFTSCLYDGGF